MTDWLWRLRSLFRRNTVERELDDELRFHFEHLVEKHLQAGLTREEATRQAHLALGGFDQIKESHRDARGITLITEFARDARHAVRQCRRAPGFATLSILCLGLGIGVNTAIFSVTNTVLLRPLPVTDPDRLVSISRGDGTAWSYPLAEDLRQRTRLLAGITAAFATESDLEVDGASEFVTSEMVPANYATVLGVRPALGRWFASDDAHEAVLSYAVWQRQFHADPDVLGREIASQSQSYTIVGIAPREFAGVLAPMRTDIWVPMKSRPSLTAMLEDRQRPVRGLLLFGRLAPSVTRAAAASELTAVDAQLGREYGGSAASTGPVVAEPVRGLPDPGMRRRLGTMAALLAVIVSLVLLIACVNVGNLLLVRGAVRRREFAMRRALGASSGRLLRQVLTESLLLALGGSICGVLLAWWTNRMLEGTVPPLLAGFALQLDLSLDWRSFFFAMLAAIVSTMMCGLLPAWRASRVRAGVDFKSEIGGSAPRRRPLGLVAQVVMSLVLLFVAGSALQALQRMQSTEAGFDVERRLYAYTFMPQAHGTAAPAGAASMYDEAQRRLAALPGVRRVAVSSSLLTPIDGACVALPGGTELRTVASHVAPAYFEIMGIGLVDGRPFSPSDASDGTSPVIVNESLARRLRADADVVGQPLRLGCHTHQAAVVVGVVRNPASAALADPGAPHVYQPFTPGEAGGFAAFVLETHSDSRAAVIAARRTLLSVGQGIRVYAVEPLSTYVVQRTAPLEWIGSLLSAFGLLALVLAAVGLYGVIAYRVALRTQEIGVRIALGASRRQIFSDVLRHGLLIVLAGVVIGELLASGLTRAAAALQEGLAPTSLTMHAAIAATWIAVALCACYVPAARAARVDPVVALRHD